MVANPSKQANAPVLGLAPGSTPGHALVRAGQTPVWRVHVMKQCLSFAPTMRKSGELVLENTPCRWIYW
jgi:hypothetical protein